jgi:hypothetical protein
MANLVEYLIVTVILLWSCYVVVRRFMPKTSFKWQQAFATWLAQKGFVRLSDWLMPKAAQGGCSAGCSDCSVDTARAKTACNTDTDQAQQIKEKPVQWR